VGIASFTEGGNGGWISASK